jgi:hypothetical protein
MTTSNDSIKKIGQIKALSDDRGGAVLIPHPVIGIVKDNIDRTKSGIIRVYLVRPTSTSLDPDDSSNWVSVKYLSPYYGIISPEYSVYDGPDKEETGKYVTVPHSYGFWATAPDIGTQVICIFLNGQPNDGYYIGCVPNIGLNHMVPAIGGSEFNEPSDDEKSLVDGATRLPVTEINYSNDEIRKSPTPYKETKPVHSYQANILVNQGLIKDPLRGVISSSAMRESPSKVFGMSTPGQAIYTGKYDKTNIIDAAESADNSKLQVEGRTGGHTFVMDDGTLDGKDQLVRIRTSAGHTILMSDDGQVLTIIHSNGKSWVELNKEGAIDVFSSNSVNIRTQGDLNLHADRDINIHAKRNLNVFSDTMKVETTQNYSLRTGGAFAGYHMGKYTVKVDAAMSMLSSGDSSFKSSANTYINGSKINLNSGSSSTTPQDVPEIKKVDHDETTFSQDKGWVYPGPDPLKSITSRAPTHMPFSGGNKGVSL